MPPKTKFNLNPKLKCLICGHVIKRAKSMAQIPEDGSGEITFCMGYGSKFDGEKITIALCDDCLQTHSKNFIGKESYL